MVVCLIPDVLPTSNTWQSRSLVTNMNRQKILLIIERICHLKEQVRANEKVVNAKKQEKPLFFKISMFFSEI